MLNNLKGQIILLESDLPDNGQIFYPIAVGLMGTPAGMLMTLPFAGKIANIFGIIKINDN